MLSISIWYSVEFYLAQAISIFQAVLQISPVFSAASTILIFRSVSDVPRFISLQPPNKTNAYRFPSPSTVLKTQTTPV